MKGGIDRRLAALEADSGPRVLETLADFVVWRARWRRGIEEEVKIAPSLSEALQNFADCSHRGKNCKS